MANPEGTLTPAQFEIMEVLWDASRGLSVAEIWERILQHREVSRTTVLNLVDRLEKRNWLVRVKVEGVFRYQAVIDRENTRSQLAGQFLGEFFEGSAANLFLSLLGSKQISASELKRLRSLVEESKFKKP